MSFVSGRIGILVDLRVTAAASEDLDAATADSDSPNFCLFSTLSESPVVVFSSLTLPVFESPIDQASDVERDESILAHALAARARMDSIDGFSLDVAR